MMADNRRMPCCFVLLVGTLIGLGIVHGLWTDRWTIVTADAALVSRANLIPLAVGPWEGKPIKTSPAMVPLKDHTAGMTYRYVNHLDGNVVSVLFTCGRPGPMVIKHLPTECYVSTGYEIAEPPKRFLAKADPDGAADEFWVATFSKTSDVVPICVRVYWSWSAKGEWRTPERPRFAFAHYPVLYRVYIVQPLASPSEPLEGSPAQEFLPAFTAELRRTLFAANKKSDAPLPGSLPHDALPQ